MKRVQNSRSRPYAIRTNQRWLQDIRGVHGEVEQQNAHKDLMAYLCTTAYHYLWAQRPRVNRLASLSVSDFNTIAEDFTQQFFCKLVQENYALLHKYDARGRFLAWCAQILRNLIASELRRREWRQQERWDEEATNLHQEFCPSIAVHPEKALQNKMLYGFVETLLSGFSKRNQAVFLRYVIDGERASVVANELGISVNGVYSAAHRTKAIVRRALLNEGYV